MESMFLTLNFLTWAPSVFDIRQMFFFFFLWCGVFVLASISALVFQEKFEEFE